MPSVSCTSGRNEKSHSSGRTECGHVSTEGLHCVNWKNTNKLSNASQKRCLSTPRALLLTSTDPGARIQLKNYEGAIEDCDTAIELLEGRGGGSAQERIADAYWQKGVTLRRSGQEEQGQIYMRRALEMGVEMYHTPTEEQLLSPYPPNYLDYRARPP